MGHPFPKFITAKQRERFHARGKVSASGCIEWTGFTSSDGYAHTNLHGRVMPAYRVAWVLHHNREIPDGMEIDHLCRNRLCINPEHLEPVTRDENLRRMWAFRQPNRGVTDH